MYVGFSIIVQNCGRAPGDHRNGRSRGVHGDSEGGENAQDHHRGRVGDCVSSGREGGTSYTPDRGTHRKVSIFTSNSTVAQYVWPCTGILDNM